MASQPAILTKETDWREREYSPEQQKFIYRLMGYAVLVIVGIVIGAGLFGTGGALFAGQDDTRAYSTNLYTEFISITITVLVLNTLAERREQQRRIADLKARLLREARSSVNDVAVQAINEMREHGWLEPLKGADLHSANLQGARLGFANLQGADLGNTNLQETILMYTDLQGANLKSAKLQGAYLHSVNLQGASLMFANLQGADLDNTNLQGADLWHTKLQRANLKGANLHDSNLYNAIFDENTTLPDETQWSPNITQEEMTRRFGCVFISPKDEDTYAAWQARRKQYAAGTAEDAV